MSYSAKGKSSVTAAVLLLGGGRARCTLHLRTDRTRATPVAHPVCAQRQPRHDPYERALLGRFRRHHPHDRAHAPPRPAAHPRRAPGCGAALRVTPDLALELTGSRRERVPNEVEKETWTVDVKSLTAHFFQDKTHLQPVAGRPQSQGRKEGALTL